MSASGHISGTVESLYIPNSFWGDFFLRVHARASGGVFVFGGQVGYGNAGSRVSGAEQGISINALVPLENESFQLEWLRELAHEVSTWGSATWQSDMTGLGR
jgi:hypothetical protein